jgi:peptidoglycan/xylan/chitin deacetylase (PgdA/CDA1 family)
MDMRRRTAKIIIGLLLIPAGFASLALAAGPKRVATIDRATWPQKIDSPATFDRASRFELLQLTSVYEALKLDHADEVTQFTGIKHPAMERLQNWRDELQSLLLHNFQDAARTCSGKDPTCVRVSDWAGLVQLVQATQNLRSAGKYAAWYEASRAFYLSYLYEQARLAALFDRITSEITTISPYEVNGVHFPDKSILLTFDDGPSSDRETEKVTSTLRDLKLSGIFFSLGSRMEKRLAKDGRQYIDKMYSGECVNSHGYIHVPHPRLKTWRDSLTKTQSILTSAGLVPEGEMPDFRPPYGQRSAEITDFVGGAGGKVILWNIDSQDWNHKLTADDVRGRVIMLLLVWRHGIVLFHDVHKKAAAILPQLSAFMKVSGLTALNCHDPLVAPKSSQGNKGGK